MKTIILPSNFINLCVHLKGGHLGLCRLCRAVISDWCRKHEGFLRPWPWLMCNTWLGLIRLILGLASLPCGFKMGCRLTNNTQFISKDPQYVLGLIGTTYRRPLPNTKYKYQKPNIVFLKQNTMSFCEEHFNRRGTALYIPSYHGVNKFLGGYPVFQWMIL